MDERKRRIAENEAIFRTVNDEIRGVTATLASTAETIGVICECGTSSCTDQIDVGLADYARVRSDSTLFLTKPGHDFPETETVVEKSERFWVVQKHPGGPAEIAKATDKHS
jgi:hypothetical protein